MAFVPEGKSRLKNSVRAATTVAITLSGPQIVDAISIVAGDRVLVKDQSPASNNGIYVCATGAWTRASDADQNVELTSGALVWVSEGTANGAKLFALSALDPITIGTTSLTFSNVSGGGGLGDIVSGQTTTGLADGDFGYLSANNTWQKARSDGTVIQATVAGHNVGLAGEMLPAGTVALNAKFTTAGGSPSVGDVVYLAASTDDAGTGSGKLTATAPTTAGLYLAVVGVCIDDSNYASLKTCKVEFHPQPPVLLA